MYTIHDNYLVDCFVEGLMPERKKRKGSVGRPTFSTRWGEIAAPPDRSTMITSMVRVSARESLALDDIAQSMGGMDRQTFCRVLTRALIQAKDGIIDLQKLKQLLDKNLENWREAVASFGEDE